MKNHTIVIAISYLLLSSPIVRSQNSPLRLTMESDKEKYTVGEEIQLRCTVRNVSDTIVAFYPYIPQQVSVKDMMDSACTEEQAQTWEGHDSLVTLKLQETYRYFLKGEVRRDTGSISDIYEEGVRRYAPEYKIYYKEVYGVFVSFPGNAYYLRENFGRYRITSRFTDANMLISYSPVNLKERKIDLRNKWHGDLTSNDVIVEILQ
jgi:hypothetical protein